MLKNKNIIVGLTGSISAYKTPLLVRELIKLGANVNVVMTSSAMKYTTKEVMSNLSKNYVISEMFDDRLQSDGAWHIHLAHKADLMIIAPCSATTLGKLANGICDNALTLLAMALPKTCPLLIAPAMDFTMLDNPATIRNIDLLKSYGYTIIPSDEGELSSGLIGKGRLPETNTLLDYIKKSIINSDNNNKQINETQINIEDTSDLKLESEIEFEKLKLEALSQKFKGKKVLITAGPTLEAIDDVRYISNHSSGKMGFALAEFANLLGCEVHLVTGQVSLIANEKINRIDVVSAKEMFDSVEKLKNEIDIFIMAAAVSDYTPEIIFNGKIKKNDDELILNLKKTKDILKHIGTSKTSSQKVIGFALESKDELKYGKAKLKNKNCDLIVVNSATKKDSGFGGDKNTITIIDKLEKVTRYPAMQKTECARIILERIGEL